jgi:hypothetical protein
MNYRAGSGIRKTLAVEITHQSADGSQDIEYVFLESLQDDLNQI